MAAPADKTVHDMSGNWIMSKTLGDNPEPIMSLQGIGWVFRKTITSGSVNMQIKQYTDAEGKIHIDAFPTIIGGIKGDPEIRVLDGVVVEQDNFLFGRVKGWSKMMKLSEIDDEHLTKNWLDPEGDFVGTYAESIKNGWTSMQVWGFETINGERRYARHVTVKKGSTVLKIRQVYDWNGA